MGGLSLPTTYRPTDRSAYPSTCPPMFLYLISTYPISHLISRLISHLPFPHLPFPHLSKPPPAPLRLLLCRNRSGAAGAAGIKPQRLHWHRWGGGAGLPHAAAPAAEPRCASPLASFLFPLALAISQSVSLQYSCPCPSLYPSLYLASIFL